MIADEVRERLRQEHGNKHPALLVPAELRAQWQIRNLTDNHYSSYVSQQVLNAASTVIYKQLGFIGNSEVDYYKGNFKNYFINKVLELRSWSIPITLAVVFESVTRRLGIKCEPVSFPGQFLLGWRDTYRPEAQSQYFYIDVLNGGTLLDKDSYPQFVTECDPCPMSPASATKVVECMSNILVVAERYVDVWDWVTPHLRSVFELLYLVNPTCLKTINQYVRLYIEHELDLEPLRRSLQEDISLQKFDPRHCKVVLKTLKRLKKYCNRWPRLPKGDSWEVKRRKEAPPVKYAVGMVLCNLWYNEMCVVTGWDPEYDYFCEEPIGNEEQPFYHLLMMDGTKKYSPEDYLEVENFEDKWIPHKEIGRYFDRFCGTHYHPNSELERLYPEDMPVLRQWLGLP